LVEKTVERLRKPEDGAERKWNSSHKGTPVGDVAKRDETQSR
jgi:hypothetical protein